MNPQAPKPATYWDYIRVEDLLALQGGLDRDESKVCNEEVLFITVHQIYELWFKLVLRELRLARNLFTAPRSPSRSSLGLCAASSAPPPRCASRISTGS